ncbi:hypothetical protein PGTUg99_021957 [Puccinia graminis f. sp. tritici]|nr:hypothetical protein PGTUg99_021957 [Puccinia graminis f. sp. tritici]
MIDFHFHLPIRKEATTSRKKKTDGPKTGVYKSDPAPKPGGFFGAERGHWEYHVVWQYSCALIIAPPPPPRTPTPTPLQKGRAIEPAPPGGAGGIALPSEACFFNKTRFQGACKPTCSSWRGVWACTPAKNQLRLVLDWR